MQSDLNAIKSDEMVSLLMSRRLLAVAGYRLGGGVRTPILPITEAQAQVSGSRRGFGKERGILCIPLGYIFRRRAEF